MPTSHREGHMPMIIEQPSLVPLHSRLGWSGVTAMFWCIWIYLWMPLLTLAAWSFGFYQAHEQFQWEKEVIELRRLLGWYSIVVAAFGGSLLLWALSEYLRFKNKHRRSSSASIRPQDLARYTGAPEVDVATWQSLRCVLAYHDDHGSLIGADSAWPQSIVEPLPCS